MVSVIKFESTTSIYTNFDHKIRKMENLTFSKTSRNTHQAHSTSHHCERSVPDTFIVDPLFVLEALNYKCENADQPGSHRLKYECGPDDSEMFVHRLQITCSCSPSTLQRELVTSQKAGNTSKLQLCNSITLELSLWATKGRGMFKMNQRLYLFAKLTGGRRTLRMLGGLLGCGSFSYTNWADYNKYFSRHVSNLFFFKLTHNKFRKGWYSFKIFQKSVVHPVS